MPIPTPGDKDHETFIKSCMSSDVMNREFKDQRQRYAICESQWRKHLKDKKKAAKASEDSPTWDEAAAEIAEMNRIETEDEIHLLPPKDQTDSAAK